MSVAQILFVVHWVGCVIYWSGCVIGIVVAVGAARSKLGFLKYLAGVAIWPIFIVVMIAKEVVTWWRALPWRGLR